MTILILNLMLLTLALCFPQLHQPRYGRPSYRPPLAGAAFTPLLKVTALLLHGVATAATAAVDNIHGSCLSPPDAHAHALCQGVCEVLRSQCWRRHSVRLTCRRLHPSSSALRCFFISWCFYTGQILAPPAAQQVAHAVFYRCVLQGCSRCNQQ